MSELYPLDVEQTDVLTLLNARAEHPMQFTHCFRRRTLAEVKERERAIINKRRSISKHEDQIVYDDEDANVAHYDKLIQSVSGYACGDFRPDDTIPFSNGQNAELLALIPRQHKVTAIRGLDRVDCELIAGTEQEFRLGSARTQQVRQRLGQHTIIWTLNEPDDRARRRFHNAIRLQESRGARVPESRTQLDLNVFVELFDELLVAVEGASLGGQPVGRENLRSVAAITDPIWKRAIISELIVRLDQELSD